MKLSRLSSHLANIASLISFADIVSWLLQYEPELFPGLIYRMKSPKVVLLVFVSGKVVLTGMKLILDHLATIKRPSEVLQAR